MYRNFFLTAWRNIKRDKTFSFLNIGGLAIGIAACVIGLLFVKNEYDFDRMHTNGNRIFRLGEIQSAPGMTEQRVPLSMFPMAAALQKDYPQVKEAVRISNNDDITLRVGDRQVLATSVINADSNFFRVFDFPVTEGNRATALNDPGNLIVTETLAKKLFDKTDVTGQLIEVNRAGMFENFTVSAVIADLPDNSHLQFEGIIPMRAVKMKSWMNTWDANWVNTYLLLNQPSDVEVLSTHLPAFVNKYLGEQAPYYKLLLQPLYSIHLDSENITHDENNYKKFSRGHVNIFLSIAGFVLLIALLNFINLATARAVRRAREVGVRKAIGANRWQLIRQFTAEAVLVSLFAFAIALLLVYISLPFINTIVEREMSLAQTVTPMMWLLFVAAAVSIGILAGVYPAFVLSSYNPVIVLKGILRARPMNGFSIRNSLVVVQFSIATVLIVSTLFMVKQLRYINNKDIGFDKEQVMIISMNATSNKQYEVMKEELRKEAPVKDVTAFSSRLGQNIGQMGAKYIAGSGEKKKLSISHLVVDYNYLDFFNIKIAAGRSFSKAFADTAGHSYIVNETLAKELETNEVIGTPYAAGWLENMGSVIGVVKDFNFNSLHNKVAPLYISMQNWQFHEMAVRLKPSQVEQGIASVKNVWSKLVPDMPLQYTFLDEHLATMYKSDMQVSKIITVLTVLAILIACLGLFGMALFLINTRIKEIGIRKVLGAGETTIAAMLSRGFLKPVAISLLISLPLAWYFVSTWLEDFAYRVTLSWWVFATAGLLALLIALVTVSVQALRAASANPVESLRTD